MFLNLTTSTDLHLTFKNINKLIYLRYFQCSMTYIHVNTVLFFSKLGTALSIRNIRVKMSDNLCNVDVMMPCGGVETVLYIYFNRPVYIISTEKVHPWEATSCSASQKFNCSFCGPKLHCRVHKSPPPHCRRSEPQSAF